jgi:hypothetical protein
LPGIWFTSGTAGFHDCAVLSLSFWLRATATLPPVTGSSATAALRFRDIHFRALGGRNAWQRKSASRRKIRKEHDAGT